jgi:hypothetical protein
MNSILLLTIACLIICIIRLLSVYLNYKKRITQIIKEYEVLKNDNRELIRDLQDIRNKNILLESVIRTIKNK